MLTKGIAMRRSLGMLHRYRLEGSRPFPSIPSLVEHYRTHALSEDFEGVDVVLRQCPPLEALEICRGAREKVTASAAPRFNRQELSGYIASNSERMRAMLRANMMAQYSAANAMPLGLAVPGSMDGTDFAAPDLMDDTEFAAPGSISGMIEVPGMGMVPEPETMDDIAAIVSCANAPTRRKDGGD